ncbi:DUF5753 domain-containing protein [Saccharopolyspora sp. NPDC002376]
MREWDLGYVPGLLQTRAYAAAVIREGITATERHFDEQTNLRLQRQTVLDRAEHPLKLHTIVDEGAVRRRVASNQVMREQLTFLASANDHPQITLQVVSFDAGTHRGQLGSFQWLGFPAGTTRVSSTSRTRRAGCTSKSPAR